jgi:hypothetical protein
VVSEVSPLDTLDYASTMAAPDHVVLFLGSAAWRQAAQIADQQQRGQLRVLWRMQTKSTNGSVASFSVAQFTTSLVDGPTAHAATVSVLAPLSTTTTANISRRLTAMLRGSAYAVDLSAFDSLADILTKHVEGLRGQRPPLEGHSFELVRERQVYVTVARLPHVKRICEIGFNAGHSASLWLLANPTAEVVVFDLWMHWHCEVAMDFLREAKFIVNGEVLQNVSQRLTFVRGSSLRTVWQWLADNPDKKCDVLSVDGRHDMDWADADTMQMEALANSLGPYPAIGLIDDTNCESGFCVDAAVQRLQRRGVVRVLYRAAEHSKGSPLVFQTFSRGVTVFQWVFGRGH